MKLRHTPSTTTPSLYYLEVPSPRALAGPSTRPTTHYSSLFTVEANWGLGSLGRRGDTNKYKTLSNCSFGPNAMGYTNLDVALADNPTDEHHGHDPRPAQRAVLHAHHGAEHASGVDANFTTSSAPAPENLTVSRLGPRVAAAPPNSFGGSDYDAAGAREGTLGALLAGRCDASSGLRSGLYATHDRCWFAGSARAEFS
ncbi:hypothetical protein EDB92DRAFT_2113429 [Lactarius akahatsu]|uniref:Uncharacterized protein n=1 Tax=Lactarius akahatsu TaxID=416441 RepID=A0AAD4LJC8_9AGAM|nr:hypothetical protein EDB92DRAFT_2113429 [Lactarius akahatsu]